MNFAALAQKFNLNAFQLAHFLGQLSHESGNFKRKYENLNYSADRLLEVFPRYFKLRSIALQYANNPEKLANFIYADKNRS